MKTYKEALLVLIPTLVIFAGIIWLATPTPKSAEQANLSASVSGALVVKEANNYDFGTISMAKGKVSHLYSVKNNSAEPITVNTAYTSCMCTSAILIMDGTRKGPFGMAGHGFLPKVNQVIPAGKEFQVEAVFDPAAHGPAGVGLIERSVTLETSSGVVEMLFSATVTP